MQRRTAVLAAIMAMACATAAHAQRGVGDWLTGAFDAQRSGWVRTDNKISPESMRKPGFTLAWKNKLPNTARGLNNLMPPSLIDFYIGYRGFRALGFFGGSGNRVVAVDTELARTEWEKDFDPAPGPAATPNCPGGLTTAVTRPAGVAYPPVPTGRGMGRGSPAKSGVGDPHTGAVTIRDTPPAPRRVPPPKAGAAVPFNPYAPRVQYAVALASDGKLHSLWVSNGNEPDPPRAFLPPNANAQGLMIYDNTAYAATTNSCGGVDNGVWALDLGSGKVNHWKAGAPVAGTAGPAAGPDGTLYAASGSELVALAEHTLAPLRTYRTGGAEFTSSPVVFDFKGRNLVAATTNDGRLHLLDSASLNEALDRSAVFSSPGYAAGSVTAWQDPEGNHWVLAAAGGTAAAGFPGTNGTVTNGAIVAFKVVAKNGKPALEPAWVSRDMTAPLPPIVVSGVVFAISSGEFRTGDPKMSVAERAQRSGHAVLYALDAQTGKELWSSGDTMTSFVHSGGLSAGGSRVYVSTYDGTQYAFGFPIEH